MLKSTSKRSDREALEAVGGVDSLPQARSLGKECQRREEGQRQDLRCLWCDTQGVGASRWLRVKENVFAIGEVVLGK